MISLAKTGSLEEQHNEGQFLPFYSEVCYKSSTSRLVCLPKEAVHHYLRCRYRGRWRFCYCAEGGYRSVEALSASSRGDLLVVDSVGGFQICSSDSQVPLFSSVCRPVEDSGNLLPGMQDASVPEAGALFVSPAAAWVSIRRSSSFLGSTSTSVPKLVQRPASRSGDRVSISAPVAGSPVRSPPTDFDRAELFPEEGRLAEWKLSQRISECGRAVGISFHGNGRGSWSELLILLLPEITRIRTSLFLKLKGRIKGLENCKASSRL
ncbi:hypothetical protein MRB53_026329 [Persea americana]|uniref:Uncharacterized protein n=1 Tax=Persea americana TaxID=3435 RepID=A0ACC2LI23_PERAE|nr:hypothetical protein MRB53_026329 [Persea americana]